MSTPRNSVHVQLSDAIGRVTGYKQSSMNSSISSHTIAAPVTLCELHGLEKYAKNVLQLDGLRIAALDKHMVVSVMTDPVVESVEKKDKPGWLSTTFGKRKRTEVPSDKGAKRQAVGDKAVVDTTVENAMKVAKSSANAKKQNISDRSWEAASRITFNVLNIRGVSEEPVCQGVSLHVSNGEQSVPPVIVAARLCGGIAIPLARILGTGGPVDGRIRLVSPENEETPSGIELPCNQQGLTQLEVGGCSLALEIAVCVTDKVT